MKGFAPIVIILALVLLVGAGAGGFVFISKSKTQIVSPPMPPQIEMVPPPSTSPSSSQSDTVPPPSPAIRPSSETGIPPPTTLNPKELLGWWEEEGSFPFLLEFTDEYFCTQYSSRSTCANNIRYRVEGRKILVDGQSGFTSYATWKIVGAKLELTGGAGGGVSLYKKIGPPTSSGKITAPALTRPGLSAEPKANLRLLKVGVGGLCVTHDGGDSIPINELYVKLNGNSSSVQSIEQFPKLAGDYIFDPGEFFVLAVMAPPSDPFVTFHVGDTVEITSVQGVSFLGPQTINAIEPRDEQATVLIGGLATCT